MLSAAIAIVLSVGALIALPMGVLAPPAPMLAIAALAAAAFLLCRRSRSNAAGLCLFAAAATLPYFGMSSEAATTSAAAELILHLLAILVAGLALDRRTFALVGALNLIAIYAVMRLNPGIPASAANEVLLLEGIFTALLFGYVYLRAEHEARLAEVAVAEVERRRAEELAAVNERLRETQAQLVHAGKLAALGEMAAAVAHEINTPLLNITMAASFLEEDAGEAGRPMVETVQTSAERCQQIVDGLLRFGRHDPGQRGPVDLAEVVKSTLELARTRLRQGRVEVEVEVPPGLMVEGNAVELSQIVLNLCLNAVDAMPEGGRLHIEGAAGAQITLRVRDSGPGVPEALRGRIFEPFFTTREPGEGTGLGLSISYGIARAHGGTLSLEPPPGGCFVLALPPRPR